MNIDESQLAPKIQEMLSNWHNWQQDEYLLALNKSCVLEPDFGWGLVNGKIVFPSLGFGTAEYLPKPNYFGLHSSKKEVQHFDQIISLRDTGEENYFHFYNDILAKLCFIDEHLQLSRDIPIVISLKLYQKPFFQYFLTHSELLSCRNWVVQTHFYIHAKTTYFCKPLTHTKKYLDQIRDSLKQSARIHSASDRRIFISRGSHRMRHIENMEEITRICGKYDIEVVDTEDLCLDQQIKLFQEARLVIGIHGAGLMNIIYGEQNIKEVIEIFPPQRYAPFHYIMLATMYGYKYDAILGKSSKSGNGSFFLAKNDLEAKISKQVQLS